MAQCLYKQMYFPHHLKVYKLAKMQYFCIRLFASLEFETNLLIYRYDFN